MKRDAMAQKAPPGWPEPPPPEICRRCHKPVWPVPIKGLQQIKKWLPQGIHPECSEAEQREKQAQVRHAEAMAATMEANLPAGLGQWSFERAYREARAIKQGEDFALWERPWQECRDWLGLKQGLFLHGPTGVGKTVLLCCTLAENMRAEEESGVYVHVPTLARESAKSMAKGSRARNMMEAVERRHLVVLDDLGVGKVGLRVARFITEVVDERMRRGLPLLVGTNAGEKEMSASLHDKKHHRVWDRLQRICKAVRVEGLAFSALMAEGDWE
ncbi:MAG: ATP-binding protein [Desulfarculaceae bacterium]|nr:ATP-binding protein [Desulfarculaceae bacterium]MCF8073281.1 ATP-binding protein [Desulfarculaceae bacterium]MCF8100877.1 ATP-binding protein [Desulfarculaceae bacterium]MCF8116667.1 ATP-binding protein [Desulfarculaceae bacterium]